LLSQQREAWKAEEGSRPRRSLWRRRSLSAGEQPGAQEWFARGTMYREAYRGCAGPPLRPGTHGPFFYAYAPASASPMPNIPALLAEDTLSNCRGIH